jgi:hypothetical protein
MPLWFFRADPHPEYREKVNRRRYEALTIEG